jgi:hypothetical protein
MSAWTRSLRKDPTFKIVLRRGRLGSTVLRTDPDPHPYVPHEG